MDRTVPPANLPEDLVETWQRFDEWRRTRIGQGRISDDLWAAAVEVATKHGVHPTSKMLQVDYKCLKRRVEDTTISTGYSRAQDAPLTFVELRPTATAESNQSGLMHGIEQLLCSIAKEAT